MFFGKAIDALEFLILVRSVVKVSLFQRSEAILHFTERKVDFKRWIIELHMET